MKLRQILLSCFLISLLSASASLPAGWWRGEVMKMPLVIHITDCGGSLYSPAQSADSIPFSSITASGDTLKFEVAAIGLSYEGIIGNESIKGFLTQGVKLPLTFTPASAEDATLYRPQTPQPPYLYNVEEVSFPSGSLTMTGTLTSPFLKPFGAIVLVSGSGTQNRDEEIAGHKPFAVIADHLTRYGWAVLRYDDRGAGGSSKGKPTDTTFDLADDAMNAVRMLRRLYPGLPVGIAGHSEGGTIAMINAAQHPDSVDFIISLAGMAIPGRDMIIRQNEMLAELAGAHTDEESHADMVAMFDIVSSDLPDSVAAEKIDSILSRTVVSKEDRKQHSARLLSPWYRTLIRLNPETYLKRIKCPMLAINGSWDVQVEADTNLKNISELVNDARTVKLDGLNHLFQEAPSRQSSFNYATITQTFSPKALDSITTFLTDYLRSRK